MAQTLVGYITTLFGFSAAQKQNQIGTGKIALNKHPQVPLLATASGVSPTRHDSNQNRNDINFSKVYFRADRDAPFAGKPGLVPNHLYHDPQVQAALTGDTGRNTQPFAFQGRLPRPAGGGLKNWSAWRGDNHIIPNFLQKSKSTGQVPTVTPNVSTTPGS